MTEQYKTVYEGGEGEIVREKIQVYCHCPPGGDRKKRLLHLSRK